MKNIKQKLKLTLGEFGSIWRVASFLYENYPKRTLIVTIISFLSCFSETLGVLTIVPIFIIISGEQTPDSGFVNTIYQFFSELGLTNNLAMVLFFFVLAILLKSLLRLLNASLIGNTYALIAKNYRLKIMDSLYKAKWIHFVTQKTGGLANAISSEPEKAAQAFNYFIKFTTAGIQLSFYLLISFAASTLVTFSAFIYAISLFLIIVLIHNKATFAAEGVVHAVKNMTGKLTEYLLLLKPIKAMESGLILQRLLDNEADKININTRKDIFLTEIVKSVQEPLITVFICVFFYLSVNFFSFSITEIVLLSFVFYRLMSHLSLLQVGYLNMIRLDKFMGSLFNTIEKANLNKEEWEGNLPIDLKSNIIFDNVTFGYTNKKIIQNLSIEFKGKKINMITGTSGCGKTTIVDLIIGLYKPTDGKILIDNTPIDKINIKHWRKQIGYVPQETILLNDSILENITFGAKYKKQDLHFALKASEIDNFVSKLPDKLNSIIGERGIMLSGGQRQRISIARALLRKPKLIILDEATANLDPLTEMKICKILKKISKKIMIITISHNKKLVSIADQIFSFSKGKLLRKKKL